MGDLDDETLVVICFEDADLADDGLFGVIFEDEEMVDDDADVFKGVDESVEDGDGDENVDEDVLVKLALVVAVGEEGAAKVKEREGSKSNSESNEVWRED